MRSPRVTLTPDLAEAAGAALAAHDGAKPARTTTTHGTVREDNLATALRAIIAAGR